ncbi:MAG: hypothetical protein IPK87_07030 [Planctomycetes bacterium]|nr:hypothetical protein [Planctomycetota bacterium]
MIAQQLQCTRRIAAGLLVLACAATLSQSLHSQSEPAKLTWAHVWTAADLRNAVQNEHADAFRIHEADDRIIGELVKLDSVRGVALPQAKITSRACQLLCNVKTLEHLEITGIFELEAADYKALLEGLPGLTCVKFSRTNIDDGAFLAWNPSKSVREVVCSSTMITDRTVHRLVETCPKLRSVWLSGCERIAEAGFLKLARLTSLETLHASFCPGMTSAAMEAVTTLPLLRVLCVRGSAPLSRTSWEHIGKLIHVETLGVSLPKDVREGDFATFQSLPALERLELSFEEGSLISCVAGAKRGLKNVTKLEMYGGRMDETCTALWAHCASLEIVVLETVTVDNGARQSLSGLLEACPSISNVLIKACKNVTKQDMESLGTKFPESKITYYENLWG